MYPFMLFAWAGRVVANIQKLEEARVEDDATERADDQSIERATGIMFAIRNPERNQK